MKTKPNFTKGPWFSNPVYISYEHRKKNLIDDYAITLNDTHGSQLSLARVTSEANAQLIASAPEMYETLEACLKLIQDPNASEFDADRVESMIESVLKKARGE